MKKIIITLISIFFSTILCAQNSLIKEWDKVYGGAIDDWFRTIIMTNDSSILLGGYAFSDSGFEKSQDNWDTTLLTPDYWIIKLDTSGNIIWDKRFGGFLGDYLWKIKQTSSGKYFLTGSSESGMGGDRTEANAGLQDYWIVGADSLGNKLFDKRYGGNGRNYCRDICPTSDGGFLIGGMTNAGISVDKTQPNWDTTNISWDFWIVKTDSSLNKIWDKDFGGDNYEEFSTVIPAGDNKFLLAGSSQSGISGNKTDTSRGGYDYWIVLIDSGGNKLWDKTYGGNNWDKLYGVAPTDNGGFLLAGTSRSDAGGDKSYPNHQFLDYDYWVLAIDSIGNKLWDRNYGGLSFESDLWNIHKNADGTFLLSGSSSSNSSGDKSEDNYGNEQTWLLKIDAHGNKLWDKTITVPNFSQEGRAYSFSNNEIWVCASSYALAYGMKSVASHNFKNDFWLVKLKDTTTVSYPPTADFTASDSIFCGNKCVNYFDQSINNSSSWFWQFPGATPNYSTSPFPTNICYNTTGVYDALLVVCNYTSCDSFLIPNYIHSNPQSAVSITQSFDTLFCVCNNATSFQWYNSSGIIPGAIDSFYVTGFATDTFYITVSNSFGCDSTSSLYTINSYGLPATSIASSDSSLCVYGSINFYDNSTNNPTSWQWYFAGAIPSTSSLENPINIFYNSGSGSYDVTLVACNSYGCDSITFPNFVNVYSVPIVNITLSNDTLTCVTPALSYQWYNDGNTINGATDSFYVVPIYGNYYVEIIDSNGCHGFSNSIITSINGNYLNTASVEILPNPFNDKLNVTAKENDQPEIILYDITGRTLLQRKFESSITLNTQHLAKGIYLYEVRNKNGAIKKGKVVKD